MTSVESLSGDFEEYRQRFLTFEEKQQIESLLAHDVRVAGFSSVYQKTPHPSYPQNKYWYGWRNGKEEYIGKELPAVIKEDRQALDKLQAVHEVSELYEQYKKHAAELERYVTLLRKKFVENIPRVPTQNFEGE